MLSARSPISSLWGSGSVSGTFCTNTPHSSAQSAGTFPYGSARPMSTFSFSSSAASATGLEYRSSVSGWRICFARFLSFFRASRVKEKSERRCSKCFISQLSRRCSPTSGTCTSLCSSWWATSTCLAAFVFVVGECWRLVFAWNSCPISGRTRAWNPKFSCSSSVRSEGSDWPCFGATRISKQWIQILLQNYQRELSLSPDLLMLFKPSELAVFWIFCISKTIGLT